MVQSAESLLVVCGCGHRMKAPVSALGRKGKCAKCGELLLISESNCRPFETVQKPAPIPQPHQEVPSNGQLLVFCNCGSKKLVPAAALGGMTTCSDCGSLIEITELNSSVVCADSEPIPAPKPQAQTPTEKEQSPPSENVRVTTIDKAESSPSGKKRIGELMIDEGMITAEQLEHALETQKECGGKIVEVLISQGAITPEMFVSFLARQPGVASVNISNYEVPGDVIALVPKAFALQNEVFPLDRLGASLTLGMVCPLDSKTLEELQSIVGLKIRPLVCPRKDLKEAIEHYYGDESEREEPESADSLAKGIAKVAVVRAVEEAGGESVEEASEKVETTLKLRSVLPLIKQIDSLPPLPDTAPRARQIIDDPDSSASDLARVVVNDPVVGAKILGVANSAACGFVSKINSIERAVSLLGMRETYSIVLSASVADFFKDSKYIDSRAFWKNATACATAARIAAAACGWANANAVYSSALLHDIGRLVLLKIAPDSFASVPHEGTPEEILAAEERHIGLTHCEAGFELATHWELPVEIALAIRFHHYPELTSEGKEVVYSTALADAMVRAGEDVEGFIEGSRALIALMNLSEDKAVFIIEDFLTAPDESFLDY